MEDRSRLVNRSYLALIALCSVLIPALCAATPPGLTEYQQGDYAAAIQRLEASEGTAQRALLVRAYIAVGRYESAQEVARRLRRQPGGRSIADTLLGSIEILTGKYRDAIRRLRREIRTNPRNYEARIRLGEVLLMTGTSARDLHEVDAIADFWQDGEVRTPEDLTWLARGLHLTDYFQNANEIFQEVNEVQPQSTELHLYWAQLFLDKEDETHAGEEVRAILRINAHHPHALVLAAYMDSSSDNDQVKALDNVQKALAVNPKFVPARQMLAHLFIVTEQYTEALSELEKALEVNPHAPRTLAMMAACHMLLEDDTQARRYLRRALAVNRHYAEGYHVVAEYVVRVHRYEDALRLEQKAIELDPEYWPSYVGLGLGYSRVGDDEKAREYLEKGFEGDSFNVRAYNVLKFFYDGAARAMEWRNMGPFRVRASRTEWSVLDPTLRPFLTAAYEVHKAHYGFTPEAPLHIELFSDSQVFSVRTSGYGTLGAHGVCFGHLVTALSPSNGEFNWAMILWHELAHIWHIQMSNSRVPRWFTEGLAEHETTLRRPEWKREMNHQLWEAHEAGRLQGIQQFNTMFTGARSMEEIVLAYYFASKVVAFIDQRWGFDVFPKMLAAWGQRKPTPVVFREVLGVSLSEFDADLKAFLEGTLLVAFRDEYEPVTGADADEISQTYISARQALEEKDYPRASALLDEVLAAGKEGAILRITRAQAAMGAKDWTTAREHLERALSLDPQRSTAYRLLREVLGELGDSDGMYALMKQASLQSEHDVELLVQIMEEARRRNNLDDRQVYSERAIHIAPFVPQLRVIRGEVALSEENYERALAEADLALTLTDGADLVSAHLLRARALKGLGQSEAARAALDGLDSDPQIESLRGELSP